MKDRISITMLEDGVADVRLIRTDKMNAIDAAMWSALTESVDTLKEQKGLRAVILSGDGRGFCAGLDLASFQQQGIGGIEDARATLSDRTHGIANAIQYAAWGWRTLPVPVIAAVHGVAFGAGSQIMAGADIRIIHPDTRFSIMEMRWGLVPDVAGMALWRTQVADDVLREAIYTNKEVTGTEAARLGFATHVADDPLTKARALAADIAIRNPDAIRAAKRLCNMLPASSDGDILQAESDEQARILRTPNQMEAVMAAIQNRKPQFTD